MKVFVVVATFILAFVAGFACHRPADVPVPVYPTSKEIGVVIIAPGCMRYPAPEGPDADVENQTWPIPRKRHLDTL